ncbi:MULTISPECIES: helix-turn-helix domain-containing protein [Barrientosiimonas]|uniref:HTH cro/C1-type domain-containing protein n=1 Tax=Barrientosiimonas endolithica TaxID=1535208 RepID=A0ABM8H884_9MICO|nr:helix-turn-helix transcriptional regulator [Barrientosiimonas endolithica]BDZ57088.1 hypothetical protein GCM10025872_07450 [Barrientosiimonas endolithica]
MTRLWREILGETIREERLCRGLRLVDVAAAAGISPQYLSEVERGRKEPSSEMVEAVAGALLLSAVDLIRLAAGTVEVVRDLAARTEVAPAQRVEAPGQVLALVA